MSYMPNASPVFMYTNNADFTLTKNATTYMPSNLNSLYPDSETSYNTSTNKLESDKCVCVFDFHGSVTSQTDTDTYHYIVNENSLTSYGRNTSVYKGIGSRLEDSITNVGNNLEFKFVRGQYSSSGTNTVHQYRASLGGVSLA